MHHGVSVDTAVWAALRGGSDSRGAAATPGGPSRGGVAPTQGARCGLVCGVVLGDGASSGGGGAGWRYLAVAAFETPPRGGQEEEEDERRGGAPRKGHGAGAGTGAEEEEGEGEAMGQWCSAHAQQNTTTTLGNGDRRTPVGSKLPAVILHKPTDSSDLKCMLVHIESKKAIPVEGETVCNEESLSHEFHMVECCLPLHCSIPLESANLVGVDKLRNRFHEISQHFTDNMDMDADVLVDGHLVPLSTPLSSLPTQHTHHKHFLTLLAPPESTETAPEKVDHLKSASAVLKFKGAIRLVAYISSGATLMDGVSALAEDLRNTLSTRISILSDTPVSPASLEQQNASNITIPWRVIINLWHSGAPCMPLTVGYHALPNETIEDVVEVCETLLRTSPPQTLLEFSEHPGQLMPLRPTTPTDNTKSTPQQGEKPTTNNRVLVWVIAAIAALVLALLASLGFHYTQARAF
ncbi:hypothetical protein Pelo_18205 [Pelomyxa schiedti]|nr:hypothetical protein Pelo_18205 [Pelomyxa schiedti]